MKGLSFSEPMVKAWLDGRKTVTRRIMKPQPVEGSECGGMNVYGQAIFYPPDNKEDTDDSCLRNPRYSPSNVVYIKETWRVGAWGENDNMIAVDYKADGFCRKEWIFLGFTDERESQFYKLWQQSTDDAQKKYGIQERYKWNPGESPCRWRSPRFMPEWASRSKAKIISVRPERVQEITEEDARREGIVDGGCLNCGNSEPCGCKDPEPDARDAFIWLWKTLHPGSWERNDWVWRIELEKI